MQTCRRGSDPFSEATPLTFVKLVKVDEEAQHEGASDEAEGRADGGRSEEEACKKNKKTKGKTVTGELTC